MYNSQYLIPEWRTAPFKATRTGVGEGLVQIGSDERVVVLTADLAESTRVGMFKEHYPDRFIEVGVAEQNMAGVAAGLSFTNKIPYISSYATFSPGRNWEQIRVSIALSRANVKIIGNHAGVSVGVNGPSHMGTEDIALMRVLPNMTVLVPADATQAKQMVIAAHNHEGPVYVRACRPETPNFTKDIPYEIGKALVYREGKDLTICACGIQVYDALVVAEELAKEGMECEVINVASIKPIDHSTIIESVKKTKRVLTIEDHQIMGGMGSTIAELLAQSCPAAIKMLGIQDRFGMSGNWEEIYQKMGLDRVSIKKAVVDYLS